MNLVEQLKRDEGLRLTPYKDTVGKLTVGYGHNLDDKGITREVAERMLIDDIEDAEDLLKRKLPWFSELDEVRQGVLVNMAFNMGDRLFAFRNTLSLVKDGKYEDAAAEMLHSRWAEQVGERAVRLSEQMRTGVWS